MKMPPDIHAVFFDLDGTLLDTAPDLIVACNQVLQEYQKPPVDLPEFQYYIHGGALMMICESFGIRPDDPLYPEIKSKFLERYQQQLTLHSRLYPGIEQTLQYLELRKIPWGVVTNKLEYLTKPIMQYFGMSQRCCCMICGDTLPTPKPHPAPLLYACQLARVKSKHCLFIGDSLSDMQAAQAAGMFAIAAAYGYLPKNHEWTSWPSDAIVQTPHELTELLRGLYEK
jgi:2-phosphoglycolate phosphatase